MDITDTKLLLVRCYDLSLSDQYWICPVGMDLKWEDINFFEHAFSDDIGDILLGSKKEKVEYALHFNGKSAAMSTEDDVKKNTAEDYLNR